MSSISLFSDLSSFAAVQRDAISLLGRNPRVAYAMTYGLAQAVIDATKLVDALDDTRSDAEFIGAAEEINRAVRRIKELQARTLSVSGEIDDQSAGLLSAGYDVQFSPERRDMLTSIVLPADSRLVRGTVVGELIIYSASYSFPLVTSKDVIDLFGGSAQVISKTAGSGRDELLELLQARGPHHVQVEGGNRVPMRAQDVPPAEVFQIGRWWATQERVHARVVHTNTSSPLLEDESSIGRVSAHVQVNDTIDGVPVLKIVGLTAQLGEPLRTGQYRLRAAGYAAWYALSQRLALVSTHARTSSALRDQIRAGAIAAQNACSAVSARMFWSPSVCADMETLTRAHHVVGADYALSVYTSGEIEDYAVLDETTASFRGTMNHVVNRALTLEL
jgi:hypothetical protein